VTIVDSGYESIKSLLAGRRLPCAIVDTDAFWENAKRLAQPIKQSGKSLRVATKSLRVPFLIEELKRRFDDLVIGYMAYTVEESGFLADRGLDDFLVAYPTVQPSDMEMLAELTARDVTVRLMADDLEHLEAMGAAGCQHGVELLAVLDLDASLRLAGGRVHLGVRRSPLRSVDAILKLARQAQSIEGVRVDGLMAYEAQIAGLGDASEYKSYLNPVKRVIKIMSKPDVLKRRAQAIQSLRDADVKLSVVNGGGTGSVQYTSGDPSVTEVSVGSGFYCPHLFSEFLDLDLIPSAFYALQVVRTSDPGLVTCQGGGYIASGQAGEDRLPKPFLPKGLKLLGIEGAGEVQTPLVLPKNGLIELRPGDPVLMRHAKAGELMEHFNEVHLVTGGRIVDTVPTYRGCKMSFL